jgi:hypothetical protein
MMVSFAIKPRIIQEEEGSFTSVTRLSFSVATIGALV